MQRSETIVALAKALSQAQAEIQNPTKNTKNTFFGSKYADLSEVLNVTREVLPTFGLSVVQNPAFDPQTTILSLETILLHESGEWMSSVIQSPVPPQVTRDGKVLPLGPQAIGSAITYLRRYGVAAIVGIAQEDDDAESLSDPNRRGGKDQPQGRAPTPQNQAASQRPPNPDDRAPDPNPRPAQPKQWEIPDQETFATLMDELYTAFKDAGKLEKHADESAKWRKRMATDTADKVLPALNEFVVKLKEAAAKVKAKAAESQPRASEEPSAESPADAPEEPAA